MATDAVEKEGLTFASLTEATKKTLSEKLPAAANIKNPVDVLGDALADRYEFALNVVLDDPGVDLVVVLLTPQVMTQTKETAQAVVKVSKAKPQKPVFACFIGAEKVYEGWRVFQDNGIPSYDSPEAAMRAAAMMVKYVSWLKKPARKVETFQVDRNKHI